MADLSFIRTIFAGHSRVCLPATRASQRFANVRRNTLGTDASTATRTPNLATNALHPENQLAGNCWFRSVKSTVPLGTKKNTTSVLIKLHRITTCSISPIQASSSSFSRSSSNSIFFCAFLAIPEGRTTWHLSRQPPFQEQRNDAANSAPLCDVEAQVHPVQHEAHL